MILVLIKIIFITTCLVWGVKISTEPGMVFEKIGDWADDKIENGNKILEPLLMCPFCMPSIYSAFGYLFAYKLGVFTSLNILWAYPIAVCGASLTSGFLWMFYLLIVEIKKYYFFLNRETD